MNLQTPYTYRQYLTAAPARRQEILEHNARVAEAAVCELRDAADAVWATSPQHTRRHTMAAADRAALAAISNLARFINRIAKEIK